MGGGRVEEVVCDEPQLYYPDVNGDGWADGVDEVYFGCRPPTGWVTQVLEGTSDTGVNTGPTGGGTTTPTGTGGTTPPPTATGGTG